MHAHVGSAQAYLVQVSGVHVVSVNCIFLLGPVINSCVTPIVLCTGILLVRPGTYAFCEALQVGAGVHKTISKPEVYFWLHKGRLLRILPVFDEK